MTDSELTDKLIKNFNLKGTDFYEIVKFNLGDIGFSVKKDYKRNKDYISLIKIAIRKENLTEKKSRVPLYVGVGFGKLNEHRTGIGYVENERLSVKKMPIDIQTIDDYVFDIESGKIYKQENEKSRNITGKQLLEEFYKAHISSWKNLRGLKTRIKLERLLLISSLARGASNLLEYFLYIISGDRYSFDPFMAGFEEEANKLYGSRNTKEEDKKARRIKFLDNEASAWAVIFYCLMHLSIYAVFFAFGLRPNFIVTLFKNNFLTITYVVVTLWLIDFACPVLLKKLIRILSNASFNIKYRKINIKI